MHAKNKKIYIFIFFFHSLDSCVFQLSFFVNCNKEWYNYLISKIVRISSCFKHDRHNWTRPVFLSDLLTLCTSWHFCYLTRFRRVQTWSGISWGFLIRWYLAGLNILSQAVDQRVHKAFYNRYFKFQLMAMNKRLSWILFNTQLWIITQLWIHYSKIYTWYQ